MSLVAGVTALAQAIAADFKALYAGKVDKVTGKGLSSTDFTQTEKDKLSAVAPGATANSSDAALLNRANHTGAQALSTVTGLTAALDAKVASSLVGAANGVAPLGADSKIAAAYLPSYVDDVLEFANFAALPATGESGKIYVTLNTNFEYRWGGTAYVQLVASPGSTDNVPEGVTNLYLTAARVLATALSGLSVLTGGAIVSTDSVLVGMGKLQKQITDQTTALAGKASLIGATFTGKVIGTLLSMAGYLDKTVTNAAATGTVTLDLSAGSVFDLTLTGNTVLAFSSAPALSAETFCVLVRVRQGATAYTFTQPSGTTPITTGGTVPATPAANKIAEYIYSTANGTAWNLYAGPST